MGKHSGKRRLLAANTGLYFVCRPESIVGKNCHTSAQRYRSAISALADLRQAQIGVCKYSTSVSQRKGKLPLISYNPAAGQATAKNLMRGLGTLLEIRAPGKSHQNSHGQKTRGNHERGSPGYILAGYSVVGALLTLLASPQMVNN